jgi:hypothetical protein
MTPLIGSVFDIINAFNPEINQINERLLNETPNRSKYCHFRQNKENDQNYFTNSGSKDTKVYDL